MSGGASSRRVGSDAMKVPAPRAVKGDATLCGLRLEALYVFPLMRFRSVSLGRHQCADCQAASWLP